MVVGPERSNLLEVLPGRSCSMPRKKKDPRYWTACNLALPMTMSFVKELRICEVERLDLATDVQVSG